MSNTRRLRTLNPGSGQMARPKHTWNGFRWPRSVHKRHQIELAIARARKAANRLKLPPQPGPTDPEVCEATGLVLPPDVHAQYHATEEENVA